MSDTSYSLCFLGFGSQFGSIYSVSDLLNVKWNDLGLWMEGCEYPWSRVRRLSIGSVFPGFHVNARDPNGARRELLPYWSEHYGFVMPGDELARFSLSQLEAIEGQVRALVKKCLGQPHIEVETGGWWELPSEAWEPAPHMPGAEPATAKGAYRSASQSPEKMQWAWSKEPAGNPLEGASLGRRWAAKVEAVLGPRRKSFGAFREVDQMLVDPDELLISTQYVWARLGDRAYRAPRNTFRLRTQLYDWHRGWFRDAQKCEVFRLARNGGLRLVHGASYEYEFGAPEILEFGQVLGLAPT